MGFLLLLQLSLNAAVSCPVLLGLYDCKEEDPNFGSMYLMISQKKLDLKATEYSYHYYFKEQTDPSKRRMDLILQADQNGVFNENIKQYGLCKNNAFYVIKDPTDLTRGAKNKIDRFGNYLSIPLSHPKDTYLCQPTSDPKVRKLFRSFR